MHVSRMGSNWRPRGATLARVVLVVSGLLLSQSARAGFMFSLDYSTLNVLPSATGQGLQFVSGSYLGSTETQAFQVGAGFLHLTTPDGFSVDKGGGYQRLNGYDHTLDVEYKVTTRVTAGSLAALQFTFGDSTYSGGFGLSPGRFYLPGVGNFIDFGIDTTQYHTYVYSSEAGSGTYSLKVDGNLVYSGNLQAGGGSSYVYFGNPYSSSSSGFVTADFTNISYRNDNPSNNVSAVPEPTSLMMAGIGVGMVGLSFRRRRAGAGNENSDGQKS